jgi:hypothetical protein
VAKSRFPLPTTIGWTRRRSSSSRPARKSDATSVPLPVIPMFFPGCCLSRVSSSTTLPLISVEFCQSSESSVSETTTFGVVFI